MLTLSALRPAQAGTRTSVWPNSLTESSEGNRLQTRFREVLVSRVQGGRHVRKDRGCNRSFPSIGPIDFLSPGASSVRRAEAVLVHALGIRHLEDLKYELARLVEPRLAEQKAQLEASGFKANMK